MKYLSVACVNSFRADGLLQKRKESDAGQKKAVNKQATEKSQVSSQKQILPRTIAAQPNEEIRYVANQHKQ